MKKEYTESAMRDTKKLFLMSGSLAIFVLALFLILSGPEPEKIAPGPVKTSPPPPTGAGPSLGKNVIQSERPEDGGQDKNIFDILDPFRPLLEPPKLPAKQIPAMSDAEIFARLFSNLYLQKLSRVEENLIAWGWMPAQDKISLSDEANVLKFLDKATEIFISKGFYEKDMIPIVRNAVRIHYPNLLAEKKRALRATSLIKPFDLLHPAPIFGFEGSLSSLASLLFPFLPEEAKAGINIPGIWETSPTCFKGINPSQTQKGVDLYGFCCNCGVKFYGYVPVYVLDCGPFASDQGGNTALCDVHLGCLNSNCSGNNNAIWDGVDALASGEGSAVPQYTNKCGCDDPQHANSGGQEGN